MESVEQTLNTQNLTEFEKEIVEAIDTGYVGPIIKQMGKEEGTLAEMAELLGNRAPSSKIIEILNLIKKDNQDLGSLARTSDPSELANGTIFLGTKYIDREGKVWFKTLSPSRPYSNKDGFYTYTSGDAESKYYGVAMPAEEADPVQKDDIL